MQMQIGVGHTGLLFIIFLILKLTGTIAWSWWWVTSPLWISVIAWLIVIAWIKWLMWQIKGIK